MFLQLAPKGSGAAGCRHSLAHDGSLISQLCALIFNAVWPMFFGANNPLLGVINIIPQFLVILATVVALYRLDRMAAWCLVPLVVWVAFASVLNVAFWRLNG